MALTFVDVESAVRAWANAQTDLVGRGKPMGLGFPNRRLRSPARGCYALLESTSGGDALTAEGVTASAEIQTSVYSATDREAASIAALAYMNTLRTITATRPAPAGTGVQLLMAADVRGPEWAPDDDEPRYLVTVTIHACAT